MRRLERMIDDATWLTYLLQLVGIICYFAFIVFIGVWIAHTYNFTHSQES